MLNAAANPLGNFIVFSWYHRANFFVTDANIKEINRERKAKKK